MNRHARRKHTASRPADRRDYHRHMMHAMRGSMAGSRFGEIDVMTPNDVLAHRQKAEMLHAMLHWREHADAKKCLFCDFMFSKDSLPPFFFFARAHSDEPKPWLVSVVCLRCKARPDIAGLLAEAVQPFFPGAQLIAAPSGKLQ